MPVPRNAFESQVDDVFLAYAFSYIDEALRSLAEAPDEVEALIVQPYYKSALTSTREAMRLYRKLRPGENIPILFTRNRRFEEQFFQYGARLLDLRDWAQRDLVQEAVDEGRWHLWDSGLYARNFLIIQKPIVKLAIQPPVQVATNLLPGPSQGEPVGTVGIPSPKVMGRVYRHLLYTAQDKSSSASSVA